MINKLMKLKKNKKGFTLIELIVVIAILGILAAILIPQFTGFQEKAKSSQALVEAKQVATAADGFIAEGRTYSADIAAGSSTTAFGNADILKVAGSDCTGAISSGTISTKKHFGFTYTTLAIDGNIYTAVRDGMTGKFSVTWAAV